MFEENEKQMFNNSDYHNKVGLYCRVSTYTQSQYGFSLEEQEERLRALCIYKKYDVVDIYIDAGISAKNTDRPEFKRLMKDVNVGKINRVLAFKLDRITRSIIDLEKLVVDLEKNNCSLECACEEINTSNANGKFFVRMLTILAQLEIERTSERTYIGLEGALKAKHIAKAPIGFKKNDSKQLEIDETTAPIIRKIFQDYLDGKSSNRIAIEMNKDNILNKTWKDNTINNILQNRLYIGEYVLHKATPGKKNKVLYDMAPQIITPEIFNQAQEQRDKNSHNYYVKYDYLFKQKLYCPICNNMLTTYSGKAKSEETYLYYKCSKCKPYYISEKELEKEFVSIIFGLFTFLSLLSNDFILVNKKNYFEEITIMEQKINELNNKIDNAKHLLLEKKLSILEMREIVEKLEIDKRRKQTELTCLKSKNDNLILIKNSNYINNMQSDRDCYYSTDIWFLLEKKQKTELIRKYINNIDIEIVNKVIKVKNINIKEDKISLFKNNFIQDILSYLNNKEISRYAFNDKLYKYYNLNLLEVRGNIINNNILESNDNRKIIYTN